MISHFQARSLLVSPYKAVYSLGLKESFQLA
jgi:hypothetical protein